MLLAECRASNNVLLALQCSADVRRECRHNYAGFLVELSSRKKSMLGDSFRNA